MKIILEFNLPEEKDEARLALDGHLWYDVVYEMNRILIENKDLHVVYMDLHYILNEAIKEHGINLEYVD